MFNREYECVMEYKRSKHTSDSDSGASGSESSVSEFPFVYPFLSHSLALTNDDSLNIVSLIYINNKGEIHQQQGRGRGGVGSGTEDAVPHGDDFAAGSRLDCA